MAFVRSSEVANAAWKVLRNSDEHYNMHDVHEEWANSLGEHLAVVREDGSKSFVVRYTGPDPEGVSQVANALATAYITPGMRDAKSEGRTNGMGAQVLAKAPVPTYPFEDNRLTTFAIVASVVLLVSILAVIVFRHIVARQLREIDDMADGADLSEDAEQPAANAAVE